MKSEKKVELIIKDKTIELNIPYDKIFLERIKNIKEKNGIT